MRNMPARHYVDQQTYADEQQRLLRCHWQLFCHVSQLQIAGDYVNGDIAGMAVFAIRSDDGERADLSLLFL